MASFDSHAWCRSCRDKGVGDDPCTLKNDCQICSSFTPEQVAQLSRNPYLERLAEKILRQEASDEENAEAVAPSPQKRRSRSRSRSAESDRPRKARKRSPEPERYDRLQDTLEKLTDLVSKSLSKTFAPVSAEVHGSSQVVTSAQPFFRPDQAPATSAYTTAPSSLGDSGQESLEQRQDTPDPAAASSSGHSTMASPVTALQPDYPDYSVSHTTGMDSTAIPGTSTQSTSGHNTSHTQGLVLPDFQPPDYYYLPGSDKLVTSVALCQLPPVIGATAKPVFIDKPPASSSSSKPRVSATVTKANQDAWPPAVHHHQYEGFPTTREHRPRYPQVQPEEDSDAEETYSFRPSEVYIPAQADMAELQSYRECMKALRHLMNWSQVPDSTAIPITSTNPFGDVAMQELINLNLPADRWLVDKLKTVNKVVARGYPLRNKERAPLPPKQLVRPPKVEPYYGMDNPQEREPGPDTDPRDISFWDTAPAVLNTTFDRISRQQRGSQYPPSAPIPYETMKAWEAQARRSSHICNQAACFARGITTLQRQMGESLKTLTQAQSKGKSPYLRGALDNLNADFGFLCKITGHMSRAVSHLSEGVLVNLANSTLMRRDAVLGALRPGARKDTIAALRSGPIQSDLLFPETAIRQAEQEMKEFDAARQRDRNPRPSHSQGAPRPRSRQPAPQPQSQVSQTPQKRSYSQQEHQKPKRQGGPQHKKNPKSDKAPKFNK